MVPILVFIALLWAQPSHAFDHSHQQWGALLKEHVKRESHRYLVDYAGVKRELATLNRYLSSLSRVSADVYQGFSKQEKLAFLINAYNAFTWQLIADHYPLGSIKDSKIAVFSPWKVKFFVLLGKKHHLDWLEHAKIRKDFSEPRIHFALNCASMGCPDIMPWAFVGSRLEDQLEIATRRFLRDKERNRFTDGMLYLSKIFRWYGDDFGDVRNFVAKYMTKESAMRKAISSPDTKLKYLRYGWDLNLASTRSKSSK